VEDQSAPIPEETTSKLGKINLWSLAAALLNGLFERPAWMFFCCDTETL
jgi:hypothetical protein